MAKIIKGIPCFSGKKGGYLFIVEKDEDLIKVQDKNIENIIFGFNELKHEYVLSLRKAGGFIFKHGGRTSHIVTLTRELGIPSVCGIGEGFDNLATGMRVRIDGLFGTIELEE